MSRKLSVRSLIFATAAPLALIAAPGVAIQPVDSQAVDSQAVDSQAQDAGSQDITIPNLAVRERLQAIEQINVTSEKTAEAIDDPLLQHILDEADALESGQER